jgi:hypothetical protein
MNAPAAAPLKPAFTPVETASGRVHIASMQQTLMMLADTPDHPE